MPARIGVPLEEPDRTEDEVVEVIAILLEERRLVEPVDGCERAFGGSDGDLVELIDREDPPELDIGDLVPRVGRLDPHALGGRVHRLLGEPAPLPVADGADVATQELRPLEDPPPDRVERGRVDALDAGLGEPCLELVRSGRVERAAEDAVRRDATGDELAHPRD